MALWRIKRSVASESINSENGKRNQASLMYRKQISAAQAAYQARRRGGIACVMYQSWRGVLSCMKAHVAHRRNVAWHRIESGGKEIR